jgi:hypothetical protein
MRFTVNDCFWDCALRDRFFWWGTVFLIFVPIVEYVFNQEFIDPNFGNNHEWHSKKYS